MRRLCDAIDTAVQQAGLLAGYLVLAIAAVQVCVSLMRYFFSFGSILLQETILNLNVVVVALAICFGVLRNVHTRVDIVATGRSDLAGAAWEALGALVLLLPTAVFLVLCTTPYVTQAWATLEGSRNVGGPGGIYLVKSVLLLMAIVLVLQAATIVIRAAVLRTDPYPHGAEGPVDG
jgi:TRAP-type mannitol/chloroaromatic compound transport system permease small subunit